MREDLLHFIWNTHKVQPKQLKTTKGEPLVIWNYGIHNHGSGPDFFNAKVEVEGQLWAGNVEMHIKASDWYAHGHETDSNYDNVILHVVWEDDVLVFRKDKTEIPTLELKNVVTPNLLDSYQKLFKNSNHKFVNCENDFADVDDFILDNLLQRLYFERLEQKSKLIFDLLKDSKNDWEKVLFTLLLKNFGLKVNGDSFLSIAKALDFSVVRKLQNDVRALESVLFGMGGLFDKEEITDNYFSELKREFDFQSKKFKLSGTQIQKPEFFRLRPHNFPTIRLSQIANLYGSQQNLFRDLMNADTLVKIQTFFKISASSYWHNHFTFGKESSSSSKSLSKDFIDLLLINTIIPLKFCYAKKHGKDVNDELVSLITVLKPEKNTIINNFDKVGKKTKNALQSQSKIQLYNEYCSKNQCLKCAVGASLLNRIS
ncbi:DUF2851 family protein [Croceitalea rosinachiae]|uniref:DUF2851 family protein n=1 Tax=Croceitalea rosinachiae TaxID=3075596 RepID=A0ABU3ADV2_9FLAO|nr:DUF2851 family protein [Croceitalea sp. F388]MDT0608367.1 DUF2851 family protein [Croceitalea sp. F388]